MSQKCLSVFLCTGVVLVRAFICAFRVWDWVTVILSNKRLNRAWLPLGKMELSMQLRVIALFEIFLVSGFGFLFPVWLSKRSLLEEGKNYLKSDEFCILKALSAGIILGVAMLHLLNDAIDKLQDTATYPLAIALTCFGIILTLSLEHLSLHIVEENKQSTERVLSAETNSCDSVVAEEGDCKSSGYRSFELCVISSEKKGEKCVVPFEEGRDVSRAIVKAWVLESSVFVHSIIIGFDIGSLSSATDIPTIKVLMVAFSFHQVFEGIGLGSAIVETGLGWVYQLLFALAFALSLPVGMIVGMTSQANGAGNIIQGCANAVAAGSLIYTALVEMIAEDFMDDALRKKPILKTKMLASFSLGVLSMALVAIWA